MVLGRVLDMREPWRMIFEELQEDGFEDARFLFVQVELGHDIWFLRQIAIVDRCEAL